MAPLHDKQLFDSAQAYYLGATILMKPRSSDAPDHLVQPAVTCAALSLKLFLKCLHALGGKDDDDRYRISELYQTLNDGAKRALLEKFDEFSNTSLSADALVGRLEALDNAFVKWRYIHEDDAKSVNLEDLEEMILAAKAAIVAVKPEWA